MNAGLTAAQAVPLAVERLPLFHWRPGQRLLVVGDRDGTGFDGHRDPAAIRTYQRPLPAHLLTTAQAQAGTIGVAATWAESLAETHRLPALAAAGRGALVVATAGYGDEGLLADLLPRVDAWLLHASRDLGHHAPAILARGRHVEVVWGLDQAPIAALPEAPWEQATAIHLVPRRAGALAGAHLIAAEQAVASRLPSSVTIYHSQHRATTCAGCRSDLIARHGGRSRLLDEFDPVAGGCRVCGLTVRGKWR